MGLTMLRLLLLPIFLWLILDAPHHAGRVMRNERIAALAIFALMATTDKLDGYLARKLNQVSKIGTLLDPVADKLLVACSVILLSFEWVAAPGVSIPLPVVMVIYSGYLVVVVGALLLLTMLGKVSITPRLLGKSNTALQLLLVILTLVALVTPERIATPLHAVLVALWWVVPIVAVLTCIDYAVQGVGQFLKAGQTPA